MDHSKPFCRGPTRIPRVCPDSRFLPKSPLLPRAERLCHPVSRSPVRCRWARTSNSLMENDHEDDRHVCAAGAIDSGRNLYWSGWRNRRGVRNANQSAASALTQLTAIRSRLRFGERSNRPTRRAFRGTSRATPRLSGCRSSCEKPAGMEGGVALRQCIAGLAKQSKAEKECSHA